MVVGYGVMSVGAGEAHLLNLCVAEEHRCRGIGRPLLEHLLRAAARPARWMRSSRCGPPTARRSRLYQSLGFEQIGMRRGYYQAVDGREDAIVLKRPSITTRAP